MKTTTVWICFTVLISFALTIVGFPENSARDEDQVIPENSLTAANLLLQTVEGHNPIPIYNPTLAYELEQNHRTKRHLFKKKKGKKGKGYRDNDQPQVIVVNQYSPSRGGYDGGHHIQPRYPQQQVQNHGWGWRR